MALGLDKFVASLTESGLVSPADLEAAQSDSRAADSEQLARRLVKKKLLTAYQAQQAYSGKARALVLGNYVVLDKLGQGGMGLVLKARHRRMNRLVALKVLSPAVVKSPEALARFQREVRAAARLDHPNIVLAYDADEANGTHFFVMQYVAGSDLASVVKSKGVLPVEQALNCLTQAALGLEFAHRSGVIHRDIKPANLLLDADGTVRILDMGLARIEGQTGANAELTSTGAVMGTVDYMAPEQALNTKNADARSDIYSLGITLWYLLTGRPAYAGDSLMARLLAHANEPVPSLKAARPDVSDALDTLFRTMVAKKPEERCQSMSEVLTALTACQVDASRVAALAGSGAAPSEESRFNLFLGESPGALDAGARTRAQEGPPGATLSANRSDVATDPVTLTAAAQSLRRSKKPGWADRRAQVAGAVALLVCGVLFILWRMPAAPRGGSAPVAPGPAAASTAGTSPQPADPGSTPGTTLAPAASAIAPSTPHLIPLENLSPRSYDGYGMPVRKGDENDRFEGNLRDNFPQVTLAQEGGVMSHAMAAGPQGLSRLVYDLRGDYRQLSGSAYCRQSRGAPIYAEIQGDGRTLWKSGDLCQVRVAGAPFQVDLRGVHELALVVTRDGPNNAAQVLFGDATLTRVDGGPGPPRRTPPVVLPPSVTKVPLAEQLSSLDLEWSEPVNLGPAVNSPGDDMNARLSSDGLRLWYRGPLGIQITQRPALTAEWETAGSANVPPLHMPFGDLFVSGDERTLLFATWVPKGPVSPRWMERKDARSPWTKPVPLESEVSHAGFPVLSADRRTLYFSNFDVRPSVGGADVCVMTRPSESASWTGAVSLGPLVNSRCIDRPSWISEDGCVLLFQSLRDVDCVATPPQYRVYWSHRSSPQHAWAQAVPLGLPALDGESQSGAVLTPDGSAVLFESNRPTGLGQHDLWLSRRVKKGSLASTPTQRGPSAALP